MSSDKPGYPESGEDFFWDPLDIPINYDEQLENPNAGTHDARMYFLHERAHRKQRALQIREGERIEAEKRLPWIFWPIFALLVAAGAT